EARRGRRWPNHHRATAFTQFGPAARGFRPLGIVRVSDGRGYPAALCRSTGGVCPVSAVEILQPCIRSRWLGGREGERETVGRLRGTQYLCAARHERLECGPTGSGTCDSLWPPHAGRDP